jgi:hypothetical protein
MAVKKSVKAVSKKVAKQPAKKAVSKKVSTKSAKPSPAAIQAEEALMNSILGGDTEGFCDEGTPAVTHSDVPTTIVADRVIGNEPGDTNSEILSDADNTQELAAAQEFVSELIADLSQSEADEDNEGDEDGDVEDADEDLDDDGECGDEDEA